MTISAWLVRLDRPTVAIAGTAILLAAGAGSGRAQEVPARDSTAPRPQMMEPVVVSASRGGPHWMRDFYRRRQVYSGHFITREQMTGFDDLRITDLMRARVPGAQVSGSSGRSRLRLRGQRCAPMVWLDGASTPAGEFDLDVLAVGTVAAVEVYSSGAHAPAQFRTPFGRDACGGVVVIWSRVGREDPPASRTADAGEPARRGPVVPTYRAADVDDPAQLDSAHMVSPQYPDSLLAFSVEGEVVASFVVDTTGEVVKGSIGIVSETSPAFGHAVRQALAASRFVPARKGGRLVRQILFLPYRFTPRTRS